MRLNDILDLVSGYAPDADVDVVMRAYVFAAKMHAGQTRRSGDPYLVHPLEVAGILASIRMDVDTIATALLHDTLEDTFTSREELAAMFGPLVADLVDGVTKIGRLQFKSREEAQAENFRKMVMAMARDVRVVIVKLADRLHNMRTLAHMDPAKQREIAEETLEIYAPIANRLGLGWMKEELETLCLEYIHPEAYETLSAALDRNAVEREAYIGRTIALLREEMAQRDIECEVSGRAKSPFSVYRKMIQQKLEFEQVHDLLAFRIVVADVRRCYEALGWVHGLFIPVPGKIKDYVAMPKANGYRSLHTTVLGPEGRRIEIQIRTQEMHRVAEYGIAAHWRYKAGRLDLDQEDIRRMARLRELFEAAQEVEDPDEFLATVKIDLFTSEVYVFTPAREVRVLPVGATVLDFAYSIHTDLGNHCTGARVDGRMVPLRYELQSGDTIEIVTRGDQKPNRDWLGIAKTGRALSKIRKALRDEERERGVELGRNLLASELKRHGLSLAKLTRDGRLKQVVKERGYREADALFVALARGQVPLAKVARDLAPDADWTRPREEEGTFTSFLKRFRGRAESPVLINGEDDVLVSYARCCNPLPGETVSGYITRGRGITVHLASCPQLLTLEEDRRIRVEWDPRVRMPHTGELHIVCVDRPGLLANISRYCEDMSINIIRAEAHPIEDQKAVCHLSVSVHDVGELNRLMRNLEKIRGVISVDRSRSR